MKALNANCQGGVVTSGGMPVPAADILSEGLGPSQGVLLIDEDRAKYLANISPDLKSSLEQLSSSLDTLASAMSDIVSAFTSIASGMAGPSTAPPPTLAADLAPITAAGTALSLTKVQIDTLKEMLR